MTIPSNLVVFDTCVVEGRYLLPLLREESLLDLEQLRTSEPRYCPAVSVKTIFEILSHLKFRFRDNSRSNHIYGYPGGIDEGKRILGRSSRFSADENAKYWFQLAAEWEDRDWEDIEHIALTLVNRSYHAQLRQDLSVQREFTEWKRGMTAFLARVSGLIHREFFVIERHHVYRLTCRDGTRAMQLEWDVALDSLYPSEDFEILVSALMHRASALVTTDRSLLRAGLSVSLEHPTAFVHPTRLWEAVKTKFAVRMYDLVPEPKQTREER